MGIVLLILAVTILVYLMLIMPRLVKKPDDQALKGFFYAHRGLHDNESEAPENSIKAFKQAVEAGYGIELDVQLTKDNVLVVFHDETLDRMCGVKGKVIDYTFDELQTFHLLETQERIPQFKDVLALVNGRIPLIVEIKMPSANALVCEITNELLKNYEGAYCIESFHPYAVKWYRQNRPDVIRGQLSSNFRKEMEKEKLSHFIVHHLLTNFVTKPDFIAYCHNYPNALSRTICKTLYRSLSVAWTITSQAELDESRKQFDLFIFEGFIPDEKTR